MLPNRSPLIIPELLDDILGNLVIEMAGQDTEYIGLPPSVPDLRWDIPALKACSQVSKVWRELALKYLFYTFCAAFGRLVEEGTQGPNVGCTGPLLNFLHSAPHICNTVRKLHLTVTGTAGLVESNEESRKSLDCIIAMFPRIRALVMDGSLHRVLGHPDSTPMFRQPYSQTLQHLKLSMFTTIAGQPSEELYLQSLCDFLAQFGTVENLSLDAVNFGESIEDSRAMIEQHESRAWRVSNLTVCLNSYRFIDVVIARLWLSTPLAHSLRSLHIGVRVCIENPELYCILDQVTVDVGSMIKELSLWVPLFYKGPERGRVPSLKAFSGLQLLSLYVPLPTWGAWQHVHRMLSAIGSPKSPLRCIEVKMVVTNLFVYPLSTLGTNKHDIHEAGIENILIEAVTRQRSQHIRIGLYSWDFVKCEVNLIPADDMVRAWFPKLDELGYLRFD